MVALSSWAKVPAHRSCVSHRHGHGSPGTLQVAPAGLTGFCYLCTMSLISFTELRSLLKS